MNTLDTVLENCNRKYGVKFSDEQAVRDFLERQQERELAEPNQDFDLNYRPTNYHAYHDLIRMEDKTLLLAYIIAEQAIISGHQEETKEVKVQDLEDLYLLRPQELGNPGRKDHEVNMARRTDPKLFRLYGRVRNYKNLEITGQGWKEVIDELGQDEIVVKHFGRAINYNHDVRECYSPNPLTFDIGGHKRK